MGGAVARWVEGVPEAWSALVRADPNATCGHEPALCEALAATISGFRPAWVVVEREGELIGGAPAVFERRGGLHWLHALPFQIPAAPLSAAGHRAEVDRAVAVALAARARELGVVGGEWALYRPEAAPPAAEALGLLAGEVRAQECWTVDLSGGLDAALGRAGSRARQYLRNLRDTYPIAEDPGALDRAYALHRAQARGWTGYQPRPLELSRRLLRPGSIGRLFVTPGGGETMAGLFVLAGGGEALTWWIGADRDARGHQAASLLYWHVAEWAAARGLRRLNLGANPDLPGVASFKHRLGARPVLYPVVRLDARHAGPFGRWVATAQATVRRRPARPDR